MYMHNHEAGGERGYCSVLGKGGLREASDGDICAREGIRYISFGQRAQ